MVEALPVFLRLAHPRPLQPVTGRLGQVGGKCSKGPRVALAEWVDGIEFALMVGQASRNSTSIESFQVRFSLKFGECLGQCSGDIFRGPIRHHKPGAALGHHADALAKFASPRIDLAEDAAVGFLQAQGVEWAIDWVCLERRMCQKDGVGFKPIEIMLGAIAAKINQNVRAWVAIRIVLEWAHAILDTAGR